MHQPKKSFFERLTGSTRFEDEMNDFHSENRSINKIKEDNFQEPANFFEETETEGQLTVDVFQTADEIIVKTMVAGVKPEDLDVNITRDMVTIKGRREESNEIHDNDYFHRELYWGSFSRTITLPEEIDVEEAEAIEKHGLLTIKLPKIDKSKHNKLKVKSA